MTDAAVLVIVDHMRTLTSDRKEEFEDLKQIDLTILVMQQQLADLSHVSMQ